jgi:hypothetical protein
MCGRGLCDRSEYRSEIAVIPTHAMEFWEDSTLVLQLKYESPLTTQKLGLIGNSKHS